MGREGTTNPHALLTTDAINKSDTHCESAATTPTRSETMKKWHVLVQVEKQGFGNNQVEVDVLARRLKGAMVEKQNECGVKTKEFVRFGNVMFQSLIGCEEITILPHLDDEYWKTAPRISVALPVKVTYSQYWASKKDSKRVSLSKEIKVRNEKTGKMEVKRVSVDPDPKRHFLKCTVSIVNRMAVWYDEAKVSKRCVSKVSQRSDRDTPRELELARQSFEVNGPEREVDFTRAKNAIAKEYGQQVADDVLEALEDRLAEMVAPKEAAIAV